MWTIVSTGDAAFLEQIFISIAMVVGTGDFMRGAAIAMLVGVFIMFFQSIMRDGRGFNLGAVLLGWILFMIMFVPTSTVVIEDNVSGSTRVVANVPTGVAASGSIISSIGYGLTELFEQGYQYIGSGSLSSQKFAEPLKILNSARANGSNPNLMIALDNAAGSGTDFRKSWDNYIRECTVRKVQIGASNADEIMNSPLPEALRTQSSIYMTEIIIRGQRQVLTCTQAFNDLTAEFKGAMASFEYQNALAKAIGAKNYEDDVLAGFTGDGLVNQALQDLGLATTNAQNYMMSSILQPLYLKGIEGHYKDMQQYASAITLNQAIAQRNTQWSMEASMFMTVIRPLQTFFEGFVYAITPILAMLIVTGSFGFSMAGKYLMLLFWVQLWLPLLSIINLYILTVASGQLAAINDDTLSSMYALDDAANILQTWSSTGGMLAASIPMIALFIVSGSTYALTNIAGKVNGSDHIDEKAVSPDVATNAPVMQQQAMNTNNSVTGVSRTGTDSLTGSMTLGNTASGAVSSASQKMQSAQQSFGNAISRAVSSTGTHQSQAAISAALNNAYGSSHGSNRAMLDKAAQTLSAKTGQSMQDSEAAVRKMALGGNLGLGTGGASPVSAKAGVSGEVASTNESKNTVTNEQALSALKDSGWTKQDSANWQKSVASNLATTNSEIYGHESKDSLSQNLSASAQDLLQSQESYNAVAQFANNLGSQASMRLDQVAGAMLSTGAGRQELSDMNSYYNQVASPEMRNAANNRTNQLMDFAGWDYDKASTVARFETLMSGKNATPDSMSYGANKISKGLGMGELSTPDAFRNQEMSAPNFGGVQGVAQEATSGGDLYQGQSHGSSTVMAHTPANTIQSQVYDISNDNNNAVHKERSVGSEWVRQKAGKFNDAANKTYQKTKLDNEQKAQESNNTLLNQASGMVQKVSNNLSNRLNGGMFGEIVTAQTFDDLKQATMDHGLTEAQATYAAGAYFGDQAQMQSAKSQLVGEMGQENANSFTGLFDEAAKGNNDDYNKAVKSSAEANELVFDNTSLKF